jgi:predicted DNA-binding antitoxin AbrB/MazE fold protein
LSGVGKKGEFIMTQTLDAIFENGSFKPVDNGSFPFSEGQRVKLIVEVPAEPYDDLIELAGRVYEGLSDKEVDEVERLALDRSNFFDRPTL